MFNTHNTKLVMCDWSGVISDDRLPVYEANSRMFEEFGGERFEYEEWLLSTTANPRDWFRARGIEKRDEEIWALYEHHFTQIIEEGLRPFIYDDAKDFLAYVARKHEIAIISAHPKQFLFAEGVAYDVDGSVKSFLGSVKNKSEAMQKYMSECLISPENAIYIGDMITDIQHARHAGVRSVAISTGYHTSDQLAEEEPNLLVGSLTELKKMFA